MYLLFKNVSKREEGIVEILGKWYNMSIGYIPDTHKDIFDYRSLRPRILDEDVAKAWMYIGASREYISVRPNTPQGDSLGIVASEEGSDSKETYSLKTSDKTNTVLIMKEIMRLILDEVYDKRMSELHLDVSNLEFSSWPAQEAEARQYLDDGTEGTVITSLAEARDITVEEMANLIISAVNSYNTKMANLLADKQTVEGEIKACSTIADCNRLMHYRYDIHMPIYQMQEEGIEDPTALDL